MKARTRRIRKQRIPEATMIARSILPDGQAHPGAFEAIDIINHSDDDQRRMVRSGSRRTVRRKSRVERLVAAGVVDPHQAKALQWYADQFEAGYATLGCTANYAGAGGGGIGVADLLARNKAQAEARENYGWARGFIPADLVQAFEMVVLDHSDLNIIPINGDSERTRFRNRRAAFRLACDFLHGGIGQITG